MYFVCEFGEREQKHALLSYKKRTEYYCECAAFGFATMISKDEDDSFYKFSLEKLALLPLYLRSQNDKTSNIW